MSSKLRIGDTDFMKLTLTSLLNLALTVDVVMPVSREISRKDLRRLLVMSLESAYHNYLVEVAYLYTIYLCYTLI
jgi:hypothetical protein